MLLEYAYSVLNKGNSFLTTSRLIQLFTVSTSIYVVFCLHFADIYFTVLKDYHFELQYGDAADGFTDLCLHQILLREFANNGRSCTKR